MPEKPKPASDSPEIESGASHRPPLLRLREEGRSAVASPFRDSLRRGLRNRWVRRLLPATAAVLVGILAGIAVAAAIHIPQVDSLDEFNPGRITRVYDRQGGVFAEFARERRIVLDETEVPQLLVNAVVALEDAKFFRHGGIDALGAIRAAITNWRVGRREEGASTITMQLARTLFYTRAKTWNRKIEEAFTAVELEKRYSKQQLLTLYCNLINFGHGNYGVAQAARYYFDKTVGELELHEAAMLAGIPQRPSDYSPYRRPELVQRRRNHVLQRMLSEGYIDEAAYAAAIELPLEVVTHRRTKPFAPYFSEEVRQEIESTYGTEAMLAGGLQVHTTLDPDIQRAAEEGLRLGLLRLDHRKGFRGATRRIEGELEEATLKSWRSGPLTPQTWYEGVVLSSTTRGAQIKIGEDVYELAPSGVKWTRKSPSRALHVGDVAWFRFEAGEDGALGALQLEQEPQLEGAAVVLESATGAIRALVGGWDFERSKFDRAVQARRQVGSAFKTFVWGSALEAGYTAADTFFDAPTYFLGADNQPNYKPRNFGRKYYGILTLRRGLEKSANMTAVKLLDLVGIERAIDFARRCGVTSPLQPYPSLALGVSEMTPLELAAAYAAIANQGTYVQPYMIQRVDSPSGQTLDETLPETSFAMAPEVAYILGSMLQGVVQRGTGTRLKSFNLEIAGKTGTTDDFSDAWFVGFTPRYTILSWVGYDQRRSLGRNMTGAKAAIPIWHRIVELGLEDGWIQEGETFAPPPGINLVPVERYTGLLPTPGTEHVIVEAFVRGTEPARSYEPIWDEIMELPWYQQRPFYLPKEGERMPEDFEDIARLDDGSDDD